MRIVYAAVGAFSLVACLVTLGRAVHLIHPLPYSGTACSVILGVGGVLIFSVNFAPKGSFSQLLVGGIGFIIAVACLNSVNGITGQPLLVTMTLLLFFNAASLLFNAWSYQPPLRP